MKPLFNVILYIIFIGIGAICLFLLNTVWIYPKVAVDYFKWKIFKKQSPRFRVNKGY